MSKITESNLFTVRRKIMKLTGGSFEVFNDKEELVMFASQKAFKLKEDIRLYTDKEKSTELLTIKTGQILDFAATYTVQDAQSGEQLGSFKRSGWKSFLKDQWIMFDKEGNEVAKIHEDNKILALLRKFVNLIPQTYHVYDNEGNAFAKLDRNFNPLVSKITIDFNYGVEKKLDNRLGIALAVLLVAIEQK